MIYLELFTSSICILVHEKHKKRTMHLTEVRRGSAASMKRPVESRDVLLFEHRHSEIGGVT